MLYITFRIMYFGGGFQMWDQDHKRIQSDTKQKKKKVYREFINTYYTFTRFSFKEKKFILLTIHFKIQYYPLSLQKESNMKCTVPQLVHSKMQKQQKSKSH